MNATPIHLISSESIQRFPTGISGFDRLLGGGFAPSSTILLAGEPGVGKSTVVLQMARALARHRVLYASGEENLTQIKLRANRLNLIHPEIWCSEQICVEELFTMAKELRPKFIIVDSLQTIYTRELRQPPNSPSQMRRSLASLIKFTKRNNTILVAIGHSTKSGLIAGLLSLEHMVDVVFFMKMGEGNIRKIYSKKNRFGPAQIEWMIKMTADGLVEATGATNPGTELFKLSHKDIQKMVEANWLTKRIIEKDMRWIFQMATKLDPSSIRGFNIEYEAELPRPEKEEGGNVGCIA